jgi:hypothetical protein
VENWFHQVKHSLLKKLKTSPSVIVSCFAENIMGKYSLYYNENEKIESSKPLDVTQSKNENSKDENSIENSTEVWKDKKEMRNAKRPKSFYFSNVNWFINHYDSPQIDSVPTKEYIETFEEGTSRNLFKI